MEKICVYPFPFHGHPKHYVESQCGLVFRPESGFFGEYFNRLQTAPPQQQPSIQPASKIPTPLALEKKSSLQSTQYNMKFQTVYVAIWVTNGHFCRIYIAEVIIYLFSMLLVRFHSQIVSKDFDVSFSKWMRQPSHQSFPFRFHCHFSICPWKMAAVNGVPFLSLTDSKCN